MRGINFEMIGSLLAALKGIEYFLLGLLVDAVLAAALFAYLWGQMPVSCWGICTVTEYLMAARYILWMEMVYVIGLWPISIPVLATPPGVGLRADLRKFTSRG
jgi:hypothetical protein